MKTLLLSALLLLPIASAQTATPALPVTTPATTAAPTAAAVLTLSAPVGTQVELMTTTVSRTNISNVQVMALPGSEVSAADLADIKRSISAGMGGVGAVTVKGKQFYRVTARDANGNVTLLSSVVQNVPGQPPVTIKITQTVVWDGAVSGLKIQSDNPAVNAAFSGLAGEKLQELADQNGSNFAGVYGQPLAKGQPRSETITLDASNILSGALGVFAAQEETLGLMDQVQSTPLRVMTTTTYGGLNVQGLHTFTQSSKYDRWNIKLGGGDGVPSVDVELADGQASGTQTYRQDGLPGPTTQKVRQVMNMTLEAEGVQVKLTLTIDQSVTATLR
ncbi:hypothetical protein [Deinococcus arenicola]|uniref:Uncharacterized protein n=1 Tax=Deinococcus arenicola TaxID=2994950 RepID=A0ABU4DQ64_9DEIO|nr:hypothetical protein [Deinococcus sp. ZS9-10]MDV6374574.1 hypothetical protein [Deinococcus sp. ZS9-10]